MAQLCEREKRFIRRKLGPGWLRRAEREMAAEPHALSDAEQMIWEEDIARIAANNRPANPSSTTRGGD